MCAHTRSCQSRACCPSRQRSRARARARERAYTYAPAHSFGKEEYRPMLSLPTSGISRREKEKERERRERRCGVRARGRKGRRKGSPVEIYLTQISRVRARAGYRDCLARPAYVRARDVNGIFVLTLPARRRRRRRLIPFVRADCLPRTIDRRRARRSPPFSPTPPVPYSPRVYPCRSVLLSSRISIRKKIRGCVRPARRYREGSAHRAAADRPRLAYGVKRSSVGSNERARSTEGLSDAAASRHRSRSRSELRARGVPPTVQAYREILEREAASPGKFFLLFR